MSVSLPLPLLLALPLHLYACLRTKLRVRRPQASNSPVRIADKGAGDLAARGGILAGIRQGPVAADTHASTYECTRQCTVACVQCIHNAREDCHRKLPVHKDGAHRTFVARLVRHSLTWPSSFPPRPAKAAPPPPCSWHTEETNTRGTIVSAWDDTDLLWSQSGTPDCFHGHSRPGPFAFAPFGHGSRSG